MTRGERKLLLLVALAWKNYYRELGLDFSMLERAIEDVRKEAQGLGRKNTNSGDSDSEREWNEEREQS